MHFGDEFQCQHNLLVIGVQIDSVMGSDDVEVHVTAVFQATLFDPALLLRILKNPRKYFLRYDEIRNLKPDASYILRLAANEICDCSIRDIEEITDESEEWKKIC